MRKVCFSCLGFAFVLTLLAQGQADRKRGWGDLDPFRLKDVHSLQISPAGDQLAFVVSQRSVANNRGYSSIWALATPGANPTSSHRAARIRLQPEMVSGCKADRIFCLCRGRTGPLADER